MNTLSRKVLPITAALLVWALLLSIAWHLLALADISESAKYTVAFHLGMFVMILIQFFNKERN